MRPFSSRFFTFLRKSYLVPDVAICISSKVPLRADLVFDWHSAMLHIAASKTIQYQQCSLSISLPHIPCSPVCPVTVLRHHLRLNSGPLTAPLFCVVCSTSQQSFPLIIAISAFLFPRLYPGGTPYNGLYAEAPPERGTFFRLQV